ncbi:polymer-forming cytoskeletal protein [Caenimonas sp. SL110]|uniref:bactofilin family protein n=1 Tax=Caenimonas sp. SL110 TaxID=1450524 RepID=UPI000652E902|nr:polymer-forming cytoskeletal protein [Caenimonas sp. SL110]
MSDTRNSNHDDSPDDSPDRQGSPSQVPLGSKMPGQARKMPVLGGAPVEGRSSERTDESGLSKSEIADGLNFEGNAVLTGVCTVKGRVQGNLTQAPEAKITVVVTETGHVKGDIVADQISVMGRTEGLLDATGGSVSLHDSANVSGHVRYFRLQVNGSDLNATLERAPARATAASTASAPIAPVAPQPTQPPQADPETGVMP